MSYHQYLDPEACQWECFTCEIKDEAFERGAAVAFGLMGMAEAINNMIANQYWEELKKEEEEIHKYLLGRPR